MDKVKLIIINKGAHSWHDGQYLLRNQFHLCHLIKNLKGFSAVIDALKQINLLRRYMVIFYVEVLYG